MSGSAFDVHLLQQRFGIVGRGRELEMLLACLMAGRHVLLEGPVGVGKTILASAAGEFLGRGVFRVDGDGRFSEYKLVGSFDPPTVLREGYVPHAFQPGPLVQAMEKGGILYINELNRMPEGVQNVLLPAMDERLLGVTNLGQIAAEDGFSVIATMNPREFVATGHLSEALLDRFELIALEHQSLTEELQIVLRRMAPCEDAEAVARAAVDITRRTRSHPNIRRGASVRAAIAIAEIARSLGGLGGLSRAAAVALPTRIELKDVRDDALLRVLQDLLPEKKTLHYDPSTT